MLSFRRISLDDRERITTILCAENGRGCEYTFGNLYIWHDIYGTEVAFSEDGLCVVRFSREVDAYLFPCGSGNVGAAVEEMMADAARRQVPFRIIAATDADVRLLEELFPGRFEHHVNRDFCEYVYNSADLIELKGKKYHGKRNHLSRFEEENPDYEFLEITPQNIDAARAMNDAWYTEFAQEDAGLTREKTAARNAFENFFKLGFDGGMICTRGQVVALSMGEPIDAETYCVHIEKACYDVTGAYTMINRDFARHFCSNYRYINREDDAGVEGLRRAKLSYYPVQILEKYVVSIP